MLNFYIFLLLQLFAFILGGLIGLMIADWYLARKNRRNDDYTRNQ